MLKEEIITLLNQYYETTGQRPTCTMSAKELGYTPTRIRTIFGTWKAAMEAAGFNDTKDRTKYILKCDTCRVDLCRNKSNISTHNFCSSSCAAKFTNKGRISSIETNQKRKTTVLETKIRKGYILYGPPCPKTLVCSHCAREFRTLKNLQYCSMLCKHQGIGIRVSQWLSSHRSHLKGPTRKSYMEQTFEQWLQTNHIQRGLKGYLDQVHFYNSTTKKNGWADYVFPQLRLIIELDGTHHIKRKHLDKVRDEYLTSRGWKVVRITHREYVKKIRVDEIKQLLKIGPPGGI